MVGTSVSFSCAQNGLTDVVTSEEDEGEAYGRFQRGEVYTRLQSSGTHIAWPDEMVAWT
jgi:hypothetical protein